MILSRAVPLLVVDGVLDPALMTVLVADLAAVGRPFNFPTLHVCDA